MIEELIKIIALSAASLTRVLLACLISLVIAVTISYIAISSKKNEKLFIGIIDILQSIPVLSFVPGVMLIFSKLGKIGIEISAIILILTGTLWNIIFSYYSSLKSIPNSMYELSKALKLGPIRKFFFIDFPYSTPQLIWNTILSFGGGWYFITYCEIFSVGELEHSVFGIGSYMMSKLENGEKLYVILSLISIMFVITLTFILLWLPLLVFSGRFNFEGRSSIEIKGLPEILEKKISDTFDGLYEKFIPFSEKIESKLKGFFLPAGKLISNTSFFIPISLIILISIYFSSELKSLSIDDIKITSFSAILSTIRVIIGITLSGVIAIPFGIFVGLNRQIYTRLQPLILLLSSIPVPVFVPLVYLEITENPIGKLVGPIIFISFSSFWYLFYNTVAGVLSIPSDIFEVAKILRMNTQSRLKNVILPGASKDIFVGFLTAWGGAWNGSFVAEYLHVGEKKFQILGIGSQISRSASEGNIPLLIFSTMFMSLLVFTTNILIWQRLIKKSAKKIKD